MPRPIDRRAAALTRMFNDQAERVARQEASRLALNELPGYSHVIAKDLRPGDEVVGLSGTVLGVVASVSAARAKHYVVAVWRDAGQWSGSETTILRVRRSV